MDEWLSIVAVVTLIFAVGGIFSSERSKKNGADWVYRKVGNRWIKVEL